ncbi:DENN (AEX-3) domain-containing protein [Trifolium repens]|nr:DENN (AEX-3) domain-containing protein [Trifolium repens]
MDTKEEAEANEDRPSSPMWVLQQLSEGAFRVAGEALQNMYSGGGGGGSSVPQIGSSGGAAAHRRCQSELVSKGFQRSDSFQKLKARVHKAWGWGGKSREEGLSASFNPEIMANQKRQWYQLHPKSMDCLNYKEPTSLFEHFVIVGLHPDANLEVVEHAFAKRKKWEREKKTSECLDYRMVQQPKPPEPTLEPQILFKYPPARRLTVRLKDLASFCFPEGVKALLLERTPSLSELNEIVYGQEHLGRDDLSFVFTLKEADNSTLYGVCLHVPEIVQRPPGILGGTSSPISLPSGLCSRFLVSAPRCYCLLTKVPFFELHFEMLNSLIAQERLNRITQFVNEFTLSGCIPPMPKLDDQLSSYTNSPVRESFSDWMTCAIPLDDAAVITAAAAGIIPDDEIPQLSPKIWDSRCQSPVSVSASDASDVCQFRDVDKDGKKYLQDHDTCAFEGQETHDSVERIYGNGECGQVSPSVVTPVSARGRSVGSSESLFSPVRSIVSEDEYHPFSNNERDNEDDLSMEWDMDHKNDLLQIVCRYHAQAIPSRGSEFVFHPLEHLQAIQYIRHSVVSLGFRENCLDCSDSTEVNAKLAAAEEALALSVWTTSTTCRVLSLDRLLALVTGVLLEKQVVILCPNLGVLSAVVLSLIPMIRPFQWQSLLLPVLPAKMIDFLDAPVPYIVGIQHKPDDLNMKTANLVEVNVMKDQVKMCHLPRLPQQRDLISQLSPIHAKLSRESSISRKHPIHRCNEVQAETATKFLNVMWHYLESLCSNLKSHTITSVQSNHDRVSLLLKDSFIDSFPIRDQPFMKLFVDTQLFTVLSDSCLSSFESGNS